MSKLILKIDILGWGGQFFIDRSGEIGSGSKWKILKKKSESNTFEKNIMKIVSMKEENV